MPPPHENSSEESLRRAMSVASSVMPHASKNCSNCVRAASSFQPRSALMMASRLSAASVR
jgi:hypothetical protein